MNTKWLDISSTSIFVPSGFLVVLFLAQPLLTANYGLSRWNGGAMGMFTTVDSSFQTRFFEVVRTNENGRVEKMVLPHPHPYILEKALALPLSHWPSDLLADIAKSPGPTQLANSICPADSVASSGGCL